MTTSTLEILTFGTALGSGLMAGLFFVFSVRVMKALDRLPPVQGAAAMNAINQAILNLWFLSVFFGTAIGGAVLAGVALFRWSRPESPYLLLGGTLYVGGCLLVTLLRNVPLNNALAAAAPDREAQAAAWAEYRSVWTAWNHLRTVATLAASASFILAIS